MKSLSVIAAALTLAASAHAATVTIGDSFSNPLATTEISQTGALDLFDSNLGTLIGATIVVNGSAVMSFGGTNNAAQGQLAELSSRVRLFWSSDLAAVNPFLADPVAMSVTSGVQFYGANQTLNFGPFNTNGANTDDLASILGALQNVGGGTFNVSCNSLSGLSVDGGGGNIATTQTTQAQCGASIEYTYDERAVQVPEPGSLALVGLALLGVGAARRRKA